MCSIRVLLFFTDDDFFSKYSRFTALNRRMAKLCSLTSYKKMQKKKTDDGNSSKKKILHLASGYINNNLP